MKLICKGKYAGFQVSDPEELDAVFALRALCFGVPHPMDVDGYDSRSTQIVIKDNASDTPVCCFRLLALRGDELEQSYAAQFYDLEGLRHFDGLMMELGRFCVHPDWNDPDVLRLAWAALTGIVDSAGVELLFGCASFDGAEPTPHLEAFAMLKARHLAPPRWQPRIKAEDVFHFAKEVNLKPDVGKAQKAMPPLLRTYLMMGGWVSDHAVFDHELNTMHVFTGLEIGAIPENRKKLLRALV